MSTRKTSMLIQLPKKSTVGEYPAFSIDVIGKALEVLTFPSASGTSDKFDHRGDPPLGFFQPSCPGPAFASVWKSGRGRSPD